MEDSKLNEFIAHFEELISKKQTDDALTEILDPNNEEIIRLACLDLLIPVGNQLVDGRLFLRDIEAWCTYQSILDYIVKISKPKEILIGLLELLEQTRSDEFFDLIIRPLKVTFLRFPTKNVDSLLWALHGLYKYISKINLLDYETTFADDSGGRTLLENCPQLSRADACVNSALNFVEPFVSEAKQCKLIESAAQRNEQVFALASFLLKLLEKPVSFYDISKDERKSNRDRFETTERLILMLFDLTPNIYWKIIDRHRLGGDKLSIGCKYLDDPREIDNARVKPIASGILSCFVYCYGFCRRRLPFVYSLDYEFESILPYISRLLKENQCYVRLGLKLCKYFTDLFREKSWHDERLSDFSYQDLFLGLITVVTYSKIKKFRRKSFDLFNRCLNLLTDDGKLSVIRMIFHFVGEDSSDRSNRWCIAGNGIRGYMIDYYRNRLRKEIESIDSIDFSFGSNLPSMLSLFTALHHREETDLLEYFDQYTAVLNLLRYLCIIAAAGRLNLKLDLLRNVREKFLDVLSRAVELSKAHYDLDLKNVVKENKIYDREEVQVLQQAGNSFDMIKSLVCRVQELMSPLLDG